MPTLPDFAHGRVRPWFEDGVLAGLQVAGAHLPFPGCGLETELGVIAPGQQGAVQTVLDDLLAARDGIPASAGGGRSAIESDRQFDQFGSSYREGDHLELNTFYRRSGAAARWNLERQLIRAGELAQQWPGRVLLHALGGDGQGSSWSSLHVNVAISDLGYERLASNYRACHIALGYYLPAQISLTVVDGNGGVGETGYLLSDRLAEFDAVFGSNTMRPHRALLVDRSERFGNARIMNMLRPLSFGRASTAGLVATQLDCLACDLMVHEVLPVPTPQLIDPVQFAREVAAWERRRDLAALQQQAQQVRWRVVDGLAQAFGEDLVERLVPGARTELQFIDDTLAAVLRDDERELVLRCDWARKHELLREQCAARGGSWTAARPHLLELAFHYARLDDRALRHLWPQTALPPSHRPDLVPAETSSWLLYWVCERAAARPAFRAELDTVEISWQGLARRLGGWVEPQGGAWPWAQRRCQSIELQPWRFTRAATQAQLARIDHVDELFAQFGAEHSHYGDYAGRSHDPRARAPEDN